MLTIAHPTNADRHVLSDLCIRLLADSIEMTGESVFPTQNIDY